MSIFKVFVILYFQILGIYTHFNAFISFNDSYTTEFDKFVGIVINSWLLFLWCLVLKIPFCGVSDLLVSSFGDQSMNPRDLIKEDFRESLLPYMPIISLPFGMGYIIQRWFLSILGNQIELTSLRPSVSTIRMPLIHCSSSMSTPTLSMRFCVLIDTLSSSRFIPSMV